MRFSHTAWTLRGPARIPMSSLTRLVTLALAVTAVLALSAPAAAERPCWKAVIDDARDNEVIDKTYPKHCYREALDHLPEDVRTYTGLGDIIASALQAAVRGEAVAERKLQVATRSGGNRTSETPRGTGPRLDATQPGPPTGGREQEPADGPFTRAAEFGSDEADAVPIPLLILGGLALLLIAAGAGGLAARKLRARRGALAGPPPNLP